MDAEPFQTESLDNRCLGHWLLQEWSACTGCWLGQAAGNIYKGCAVNSSLAFTAALYRLLLPLRAGAVLLPFVHIDPPVGLDEQMLVICQSQRKAQACIYFWQLLGIDLQASKRIRAA